MHIAAKKFTYFAIYLAILCIIAASFMTLGWKLGNKQTGSIIGNNLAQLGSFKIMNGEIKEIGNNSLVIQGTPLVDRPCAVLSSITKKVVIDSQTKVYRERQKTVEEINQPPALPDMPVSMIVQEEIKPGYLKVGDKVTVYAREAIGENDDLTADQIVVLMVF
ncbi:MAG: hypothetical protein V1692_01895 [bacterium]